MLISKSSNWSRYQYLVISLDCTCTSWSLEDGKSFPTVGSMRTFYTNHLTRLPFLRSSSTHFLTVAILELFNKGVPWSILSSLSRRHVIQKQLLADGVFCFGDLWVCSRIKKHYIICCWIMRTSFNSSSCTWFFYIFVYYTEAVYDILSYFYYWEKFS